MPVFEAIELEWKGKTYTIPPRKVLEAIAAMEDHITLAQLSSFGEHPQLAKLSRAFAAALKVAGARNVSADDVYAALFQDDQRDSIAGASLKLLLMMLPPAARAKIDEDAPAEGGGEGNAPAPAALH